MFSRSLRVLACLAGSVLLLPGCGQPTGEPPEKSQAEAPVAPAAPAEVEVTEEMGQILAKADAVDGAEDHTISKCASCLLSMDGSSEFALTVGDYTMNFCSADCKQNFAANLAESVLAMKVPEKAGGEMP